MKPSITSPQAIKLNQSCSGQVRLNGLNTGFQNESAEPKRALKVPRVPFINQGGA